MKLRISFEGKELLVMNVFRAIKEQATKMQAQLTWEHQFHRPLCAFKIAIYRCSVSPTFALKLLYHILD